MTDGEFNSLRTMGSERPISLLQLISDSRKMARSMRVSQIEHYFTLDAHGKQRHFYLYSSSVHTVLRDLPPRMIILMQTSCLVAY